jgi:hypothetical protein
MEGWTALFFLAGLLIALHRPEELGARITTNSLAEGSAFAPT